MPIITDLWNALLVHPLISLLVLAYDVVPDFGLAVGFVTIAIRLALFPVFRAQLRSSRAMQELAPALNEIKKKYGNDRVRLQQEQMKLYGERGVNPLLTGCLPLVIFFPVLFAMYAAFQQVGGLTGAAPLTVEQLRDHVLLPFIPTPPGLGPDDHLDLTAHWLAWIGPASQPAEDGRPDAANHAIHDLLLPGDHGVLVQGPRGRGLHLLHHHDAVPDRAAVLRDGLGSAPALGPGPP